MKSLSQKREDARENVLLDGKNRRRKNKISQLFSFFTLYLNHENRNLKCEEGPNLNG